MDSAINFVEANMYKDFHLVWVNICLKKKPIYGKYFFSSF